MEQIHFPLSILGQRIIHDEKAYYLSIPQFPLLRHLLPWTEATAAKIRYHIRGSNYGGSLWKREPDLPSARPCGCIIPSLYRSLRAGLINDTSGNLPI